MSDSRNTTEGIQTGDLDDGSLSGVLGNVDASVRLFLDLVQSGTRFSNDELDELRKQRHFQDEAGIDDALDLGLQELLASIHALLVTTETETQNVNDADGTVHYGSTNVMMSEVLPESGNMIAIPLNFSMISLMLAPLAPINCEW